MSQQSKYFNAYNQSSTRNDPPGRDEDISAHKPQEIPEKGPSSGLIVNSVRLKLANLKKVYQKPYESKVQDPGTFNGFTPPIISPQQPNPLIVSDLDKPIIVNSSGTPSNIQDGHKKSDETLYQQVSYPSINVNLSQEHETTLNSPQVLRNSSPDKRHLKEVIVPDQTESQMDVTKISVGLNEATVESVILNPEKWTKYSRFISKAKKTLGGIDENEAKSFLSSFFRNAIILIESKDVFGNPEVLETSKKWQTGNCVTSIPGFSVLSEKTVNGIDNSLVEFCKCCQTASSMKVDKVTVSATAMEKGIRCILTRKSFTIGELVHVIRIVYSTPDKKGNRKHEKFFFCSSSKGDIYYNQIHLIYFYCAYRLLATSSLRSMCSECIKHFKIDTKEDMILKLFQHAHFYTFFAEKYIEHTSIKKKVWIMFSKFAKA